MILFSEYIFNKNKKELLYFFERENLDLLSYDTSLILEQKNWSRIKKALLAGATMASLASPYLFAQDSKGLSPEAKMAQSDRKVKTREEKLADANKRYERIMKAKHGESWKLPPKPKFRTELTKEEKQYCKEKNIKNYDPNNSVHYQAFLNWASGGALDKK